MLDDERRVDALGNQLVQGAIIGTAIHAPEPGTANVGEPGAELEAKKVEIPKIVSV